MRAVDRQLLREARRGGQDRLHRQRRADDSGRADQYVAIGDLQRFAGRRRHQLRVLVARLAGAGIGIARIDDDRRSLAAVRRQRRAVELDRRRGELVLREDRRAGHRLQVIGGDQRHVELAPLDAGVTAGGDEAFRRGNAHG